MSNAKDMIGSPWQTFGNPSFYPEPFPMDQNIKLFNSFRKMIENSMHYGTAVTEIGTEKGEGIRALNIPLEAFTKNDIASTDMGNGIESNDMGEYLLSEQDRVKFARYARQEANNHAGYASQLSILGGPQAKFQAYLEKKRAEAYFSVATDLENTESITISEDDDNRTHQSDVHSDADGGNPVAEHVLRAEGGEVD